MSDLTAPLVSICIPTYNAAVTIREALSSIVNQTYKNLDIHIVDNASTDDTLKVVSEFNDHRITIHRHNINIGGEGNFNRCMQLGIGKYTAIYHADDLYNTKIVQSQVDFLERYTEAGAVFTEANLINEAGKVFGRLKLPKELLSPEFTYNFPQLFKIILHRHNFFVCPSAMVRTEIYKKEIKLMRGNLFKSSADLDIWLRISLMHPVGFLPSPLMSYRISKFQFSEGLRNQTHRSDFYLVTDYYLAQNENQILLNGVDQMHYRWLKRTDKVRRAINLFSLNRTNEANELCDDAVSLDALRAAIDTRAGLLTLLAGVYIKTCVALRFQVAGLKLLNLIKKLI
jgi:glycosyltransferase involved in cell wall biosynthesis